MRKRHLALFVVIVATLAVVACGGGSVAPTPATTPQVPAGSPSTGPTVLNLTAGDSAATKPDCGAAWQATLQQLGAPPSTTSIHILSWNNYDNGVQLERGIDNCVVLQPSIADATLSWTAQGNTALVDHYELFSSPDGANLTHIASAPAGATSLDLSSTSLVPGQQYYFVLSAIGKPSVLNKVSSPITYVAAARVAPSLALAVTPLSGIAPVPVTATATPTLATNDSITSSTIDFGDGATIRATSGSHTYSAPGTYTVRASVTDRHGVTASASAAVVVAANQPPVARLALSTTSGTAPVAVTANTAGSADPDGAIQSTSIDFGDGTIVSAVSASHTYTTAGTFTVRATVTDNLGASASITAPLVVSAAVVPPPTSPAAPGTTWYVRPDGGDRTQCTGQADAPYSGSGTNQPCAFKDFRYLWTNGSRVTSVTVGAPMWGWIIAGGDTVILRGGPWRVGYSGPNATATDWFLAVAGNAYASYNPPIPAGTAQQHTRILGENYASCTSKTQIHGGYAVDAVLNLKGTQFVDVQCIEITDHAQCARGGSPTYPYACSTSTPKDDYAKWGIVTDNTTANILLKDLDIHGLTSRAMIGAIGGLVTVDHVRMAFNGGAGWDFDDGVQHQLSTNGVVNASDLTVEGNGCNEEYPVTHKFPAISCYDQNSAGYGDGIGTSDTPLEFNCDHCTFRYNTQDGLDLLHTFGSSASITNSSSYGNMGQQWKTGALTNFIFRNNVTVHNCRRLSAPIMDAPSTFNAHLSNFCRASGDMVALKWTNGGNFAFENNTFVTYGGTAFDILCSASDCTGGTKSFRNNVVVGYISVTGTQLPGGFCYSSCNGSAGLTSDAMWTSRSNNILYHMRGGTLACTHSSENCTTDPSLVSLPGTLTQESDLDVIDLHLRSASPGIDAGVAIPAIKTDFDGRPRPRGNGYDLGAFEY